MDLDAYRDIAPYRGKDVTDAVARVLKNEDAVYKMLSGVAPTDTEEQKQQLHKYAAYIMQVLGQVKT